MKFKNQNGLLIPIPKEEPKKIEHIRAKKWTCWNCDRLYDSTVEPPAEEYTTGNFRSPFPNIPCIRCPDCNECMGCGFTNECVIE